MLGQTRPGDSDNLSHRAGQACQHVRVLLSTYMSTRSPKRGIVPRTETADFPLVVRKYRPYAVGPAPVNKPTPRTQPAKAQVTPPPLREQLTARELEVVELISEGFLNKEIAKRLAVSEETVKAHVRHLLPNLGARSRGHAVAIAFRQRLTA
jgi:DNA-binding CsgD family transcriptional regulator